MPSIDISQWISDISLWASKAVPIFALAGGIVTLISGTRKFGHKIKIEWSLTKDALSAPRVDGIVLTNRKERLETLEKLVVECVGIGFVLIEELQTGAQLAHLESTKIMTNAISAYSVNGKIIDPFTMKIRLHWSSLQKKLPKLKTRIDLHRQMYYQAVIGYESALCISYFNQENLPRHVFVKRNGEFVGDWDYSSIIQRMPDEAMTTSERAQAFLKETIPQLDPSRLHVDDLRIAYTDKFKVGFDSSAT